LNVSRDHIQSSRHFNQKKGTVLEHLNEFICICKSGAAARVDGGGATACDRRTRPRAPVKKVPIRNKDPIQSIRPFNQKKRTVWNHSKESIFINGRSAATRVDGGSTSTRDGSARARVPVASTLNAQELLKRDTLQPEKAHSMESLEGIYSYKWT